jgi:Protein of unknown function (DUF3047)
MNASPLPPLVTRSQVGAGWRVATLPQQKPPVTRFAAELVGGRNALRIDAHASYGNLVFDAPPKVSPPQLSWAWRMQQANPGADLSNKATDDTAAKVCLSFDLPLAQVPFVERQLVRMARTRSGENLPTATLCWVWGAKLPHGQLLDNPYTRRLRYIVLRNESDALHTWFEETRDVAADFKRAFGHESPLTPPLVAVVVGGDADNTGAQSVAYVAGLRWAP